MAIATRALRSRNFLLSPSETISGIETRRAFRKKYGDLIATDQSLVAPLERRRQRGARPVDTPGLWRAAPDGAALHAAPTSGPHTADDGVDPRGLFAPGRA